MRAIAITVVVVVAISAILIADEVNNDDVEDIS
jgi:hypothetical protein